MEYKEFPYIIQEAIWRKISEQEEECFYDFASVDGMLECGLDEDLNFIELTGADGDNYTSWAEYEVKFEDLYLNELSSTGLISSSELIEILYLIKNDYKFRNNQDLDHNEEDLKIRIDEVGDVEYGYYDYTWYGLGNEMLTPCVEDIMKNIANNIQNKISDEIEILNERVNDYFTYEEDEVYIQERIDEMEFEAEDLEIDIIYNKHYDDGFHIYINYYYCDFDLGDIYERQYGSIEELYNRIEEILKLKEKYPSLNLNIEDGILEKHYANKIA